MWKYIFGIILSVGMLFATGMIMHENNSRLHLEVSGTEYYKGVDVAGKVFLKLADATGKNIDKASCNVTIFNSDKSPYISAASAKFQSDGIYYYDFALPMAAGVYPVNVKCVNGAAIAEQSAEIKVNELFPKLIANLTKTGIAVFGTEYQSGDNATTFIQLTRNYYPVNNATCYLTAYYPDKSVFMNHVVMNYLPASDGLYYYDYPVGSQLGIYMLSVTCVLPQTYYIENFLNYNSLEDWSNVVINNSKAYLNNITNSTPVADARVDSYFPTTNYGTVNSLAAGLTTTPFTLRTYINFGLDYLRGRNVTSAYLYLRNYFTTGVTNMTVNLANASWNETTITWNNQPTFSTANRTVNIFSGSGVWRKIDVTNLTRMIAEGRRDYGFVLADANESVAGNHNMYFQSREDAALKPYLEITYGSSENFGFVKTIPYNLTQDSWLTFSADYNNQQGETAYAILNGSNNNTFCNGLGSIYSCAGTNSSIKMYANLSRAGAANATPEIDRMYVQMASVTQEEIRGGGELHVSQFNFTGGGAAEVNLTGLTGIANSTLQYAVNISLMLNDMNLTTNQKLDLIFNYLNATNQSIMGFLAATNQTYMEFFTNIQNNVTFIPQIYNNQVVFLPLINQTTQEILSMLTQLNSTINSMNTSLANNSQVMQMLQFINETLWYHVYGNQSISWTTSIDSTLHIGDPITWITIVKDADNAGVDDATCRIVAYLPSSALWVNTTMQRIMAGTYRHFENALVAEGTHNYNVTCMR